MPSRHVNIHLHTTNPNMSKLHILSSIFLLSFFQLSMAQKHYSDANIVGHVVCQGKHIPFANVSLKGTTVGTTTDETGHFQLINLPEGEHIIVVTNMGYKSQERKITIQDRAYCAWLTSAASCSIT